MPAEFVRKVSMSVCVCVRPQGYKFYIHVILNLYNQLNKFVAFRNVTKLSMHERGHCNKACHDRNQLNKAISVPKSISFTERVVLMAVHE